MKTESAKKAGYIGTAFLAASGAVLMTLLGTVTYNNIMKSRNFSDGARGTLSYIQTQVKNHGSEDAVSVRDGMLVLSESDGENFYEIRIYEQEGKLLEEYSAAGSEKNPESAEIIAETEHFCAELVKDGLLRVETDYGTAYSYIFAGGAK